MKGEYKATNELIRVAVDADGLLRTKPEGVHLTVPPTLVNNEQHRLTLTDDAKLRVDDPTTQAAVQDIEDKLDHAVHGLAALQALISGLPQFTEGLTEQSAGLGRNYAVIAAASYAELLSVTAAGYITSIMIQLKLEAEANTDFIIEVDGSEVGIFSAHADSNGNCHVANPVQCACFITNWHADFKHVFILSPMYRFDTSFKIQIYNNAAAPKSVGSLGSITYLTE